MRNHGSVTGWIHKLKEGQEGDLQQQLWNRYFEQLVRLARNHLSRGVSRSEDEEDAVLSALGSFFVRVKAGQFPELSDRTSLWPLLVNITMCKTRDIQRRQNTMKRDARRTISQSASEDEIDWLQQIANEAPSPELAVEAAEEANRLIDLLGKETLQSVARMKLEGYTNAEIAAREGVMERSIERRLVLIREMWADEINQEP